MVALIIIVDREKYLGEMACGKTFYDTIYLKLFSISFLHKKEKEKSHTPGGHKVSN